MPASFCLLRRSCSCSKLYADLESALLRRYTYNVWQDLTHSRQKIVRDEVEEVLILVQVGNSVLPNVSHRDVRKGEVEEAFSWG